MVAPLVTPLCGFDVLLRRRIEAGAHPNLFGKWMDQLSIK
jgi:hypothetical protein